MTSPFEFATANRIIFGAGTVSQVPALAASLGTRALVVVGRSVERAQPLLDGLAEAGVGAATFQVTGEPKIADAQAGVAAAREADCDVVIGLGGGSVIDAAKAISGLLTNTGEVLDYLEVIGKGMPLTEDPAPYIAVPTTAGTGAEVTRNAVLASPQHRVKVSLRHPLMLPTVAVVDPELTLSMPPSVTAATGLDAFTQSLEPYVSHLANPLTDAVCREGMARAAKSLRRAYTTGDDLEARTDMAITSLCGGLALANAKLGAVHGFAGPLGGMFPAPHGTVCACLLPHVMRVNVRALRERAPNSPSLTRYNEVAQIVTGSPNATATDGVAWVEALCTDLAVPPLSSFGITPADYSLAIEKSRNSSSMKGNPLVLTDAELEEILQAAG
jgi:alcohol dehydrogenase class IV